MQKDPEVQRQPVRLSNVWFPSGRGFFLRELGLRLGLYFFRSPELSLSLLEESEPDFNLDVLEGFWFSFFIRRHRLFLDESNTRKSSST